MSDLSPLTNNQLLSRIVELLEEINSAIELLNEDVWNLNLLVYENTPEHRSNLVRKARRHE